MTIPVQRLGGLDGSIVTKWRTVDDTAKAGENYEGGQGVIRFEPNQVCKKDLLCLVAFFSC